MSKFSHLTIFEGTFGPLSTHTFTPTSNLIRMCTTFGKTKQTLTFTQHLLETDKKQRLSLRL